MIRVYTDSPWRIVGVSLNGASTSSSVLSASERRGASTDISDIDRPGLAPRANYNIGIGNTFGFPKKDPFGDELTFGYTYENSGTHGFLHTGFGEHTESAEVMRNFPLPGTKRVAGRDRALRRSQFHLDSGKLQQSGHGAVVHHREHRLHVELVKGAGT